MNIGIIIQARLASTRLPNKILLDFYKGKTILEILYDRIISNTNYPVIVATTTNSNDDLLVDFCKKRKMNYYRGSEKDVLSRFISAAECYNFSHIIRVCSDNPCLYFPSIMELGSTLSQYTNSDYIGFKIGEKPSILTHYGFWAELVCLNALYKANETDKEIYHEHVTNYLYTHPEKFNIKWLELEEVIKNSTFVRLTVDDIIDFNNAQSIYKIVKEDFNPVSVIEIINNNATLKQSMLLQILKHSK
jgi:spore coat polysaccharide biosynthesis protein SpsF